MMIIVCEQCGKKGTLEGESYAGKKLKLKCPYCAQAFLFSVPLNGDAPLLSAALSQTTAPPAFGPEAPTQPAVKPAPAVVAPPPPPPPPPAPAVAEPSDAVVLE